MSNFKPSHYNHLFIDSDGSGILCNTKSLGVIHFDSMEVEHVKRILLKPKKDDYIEEQNLFEVLVNNKFLIEDTIDEKNELQKILQTDRSDNGTIHFTIAPTLNCNFSCIYCFEDESSHCGNQMSVEIQQRFIRFLVRQFKYKNPHLLNIVWYGGEPLLGLSVIENLSKKCIQLCQEFKVDYIASMISNGYCLTPSICDRLVELKVSFLQITLDGPESIHNCRRMLRNGSGSYARIVENISYAYKKIPISVRVNVDKSNYDSVKFLLDDLERRGIDLKDIHIYLGHVKYNGCSVVHKNHLDRREFAELESNFVKQFKVRTSNDFDEPCFSFFKCGLGTKSAYLIGPKGEMYRCYDDFGDPSKVVGSLFSDERFNSEYEKEFTEFDPFINSECQDCLVLPLCMGGCHKQRIKQDQDDHCSVYKYVLESRVKDYVKDRINT